MREINLPRIVWQIAGFLLVVACAALPTSAQTCTTRVTARPTNVIFGPQTVGTTSAAQTVTFAGSTTCPSFTLNTFTIGGANAGDFNATGGVTNPCSPLPITSTAITCTVGVTFTPAATGTRSATLSFASTGGTATVNLVGGDEIVFVSTQSGGQILEVDGATGAFTVVSGNPDDVGFSPEGMVVGPDGKLYITDPSNGRRVWRMNQDGTQPEVIYNQNSCEFNCALSPQGPSFSSSSTGDLYFNTEVTDLGGVFAILGVGTTPFGGPFSLPVNIVPGTCPACFTPGTGAGTAFDDSDNLLFVEQANGSNPNSVLSVSPPYTADNNLTTLVSGLTNPTAVALNRATGQLFVSDTGTQRILAIGSDSTTTYFTFTTSTTCIASDSGLLPDLPVFMQFDTTGHLFVVTTTNPLVNGCGKVWRIDPGTPPTATLLLDLQAADQPGSGLNSSQAIGLALPETGIETATLNGSAQTITFPFFGASISFTVPAGWCSPAPCTVKASAKDTPDALWQTESANYPGTHIAPVATLPGGGNVGGDGIVYSVTCTDALGNICSSPLDYTTTMQWPSPQTDFCSTGALGKEETTTWENIRGSCSYNSDPGPVISGNSAPRLSRWAAFFGVTGTPSATVTITTPANGATYVLGEVVNANYSCSGIFFECAGTVTNGTPIDTSSLGTKTFTAEADVTSGPTATASSTYTVVTGAVASVSPTSLNLGNVPVGEFAFGVVTVKNPGTKSLNIASVRVVSVHGGDSDDFFIFSLCPRALGGGKSCIIIVGFFADEVAVNPQSATLIITYNEAGNPQQPVRLIATVVKKDKD